jgi:hypothetical protein
LRERETCLDVGDDVDVACASEPGGRPGMEDGDEVELTWR